MPHVYLISVRPASATKPAELIDAGIATVFVADSFPDPEDAARSYLVKHGYTVEEVEEHHMLDDALLRKNYKQLHKALRVRGIACEIAGAP